MNNLDKVQQLRESIRQMERKLGVLEESEISCCGITFTQCHALVEIGRAKDISLGDLSEMLNLDNSTMSRTVNNLVNSELAERELDPKDRRYVTIRLTESGKKLFEDIEESMYLYYQRVFQSISAEKQDQVLESLQILLEAISNIECCK